MDVDIRMLHSLMVQVETYLTHRSFSSKKGGFKIKINGVQIYKVRLVFLYKGSKNSPSSGARGRADQGV